MTEVKRHTLPLHFAGNKSGTVYFFSNLEPQPRVFIISRMKDEVMDVKIERLQPEDRKEASRVIALALQVAPNFNAIFRQAPVGQALRGFARATRITKMERKHNQGIVAKSTDQIIGVLNMIQSPNCQVTFFERLKLIPHLLWVYGAALFRVMKIASVWKKKDPPFPHWHLGPFGVLPEFQGKGIGTQLFQEGMQIIDETGMDAYLETSSLDSTRLYERFGFSVIDKVVIMGNTNWLMQRTSSVMKP